MSTAKFYKTTMKKGDKTSFPRKGDNVNVWYTGWLLPAPAEGAAKPAYPTNMAALTCFDSNVTGKNKQKKPLKFKLGSKRVIRGVRRS